MNKDEDIIILDVGGHKFKTLRSTLCKESSKLEAMFSGRHRNPARQQEDGSFFIDRDGTHFQHILNYLRVGYAVSLPSDEESKEALAVEADYYGLGEMLRVLRMPTAVDVEKLLSPEVLAIRKEEDKMRAAFKDGSAKSLHPFHGLESLFPTPNVVKSVSMPLTYEPVEDRHDMLMDMYYEQDKSRTGIPVTVSRLDEFLTNFEKEHPFVLERLSGILEQEKVIIAGGSVLKALSTGPGLRTTKYWEEEVTKGDVDLFVYCESREEANRVAKSIFYALAVDDERWEVERSSGVITMFRHASEWRLDEPELVQKVQIVLRLYESPTEVLFGFDCDCCCCAFDGRTVWATQRCLEALRKGMNVLNPLHSWPKKASYELRLSKYAYRGFPVSVPGLRRKYIDHYRLQRAPMRKILGLARLVILATDMDDPNIRPYARRIMLSGYEDEGGVIVPTIYRERYDLDHLLESTPPSVIHDVKHIRASQYSRDAAWREIVYAGDGGNYSFNARLIHAWDTEKRSREYLNMDGVTKYELDNVYYNHAYVQDATLDVDDDVQDAVAIEQGDVAMVQDDAAMEVDS